MSDIDVLQSKHSNDTEAELHEGQEDRQDTALADLETMIDKYRSDEYRSDDNLSIILEELATQLAEDYEPKDKKMIETIIKFEEMVNNYRDDDEDEVNSIKKKFRKASKKAIEDYKVIQFQYLNQVSRNDRMYEAQEWLKSNPNKFAPFTRHKHANTVKNLEQLVVSKSVLDLMDKSFISAKNSMNKSYLAVTVIGKLNTRREIKRTEARKKRKAVEEEEEELEAMKMRGFYSYLQSENIPEATLKYISDKWNEQFPDGKDNLYRYTPVQNRFKKHHIHLMYEILLDRMGEWDLSTKVTPDQKKAALAYHNRIWSSEEELFNKDNLTKHENDPTEGWPTLDEEIKEIQEPENDDPMETDDPRNQTPYEVLGVAPDANEASIKKAFRRLALQFHPDKQRPDATKEERTEAEARFKAVHYAYELLSDPVRRDEYDQRGVMGGRSYNISKKSTRIRSKFRKRKSKSIITRKLKKHQKSRKPKEHRKSRKSRKYR